jgi:uncharacterized membrane protein YeiH
MDLLNKEIPLIFKLSLYALSTPFVLGILWLSSLALESSVPFALQYVLILVILVFGILAFIFVGRFLGFKTEKYKQGK